MKLHFGHLVLLGALLIGGCAAFFSVYGISQLFAGAFWAVVIMASVLEFGKLVLAGYVQRYSETLGGFRKAYLVTLVIFLMIITSAGIYGLLSSAYQKTYKDYTIMQNDIAFLEQKKSFFQTDVDRFDKDIAQINDNISTLSGAKVSNIQVRDTSSSTGVRNTISTTELRAAQTRIAIEETNKKALESKRIVAVDSLNKYATNILTLEKDTNISGELGPLIYLQKLTGLSMDKVVNFFILLLIFVFDPMAIMMVISASKIFEEERLKKEAKEPKPLAERQTDYLNKVWDKVDADYAAKDNVPNHPGKYDKQEPVEYKRYDLITITGDTEPIFDGNLRAAPATPNAFIHTDKDKNMDAEVELTTALNKAVLETMEEDITPKVDPIIDEPTIVPPQPIITIESIPQDENPVVIPGMIKPPSGMGTTKVVPVIPTGSVERKDIKEIKQGARRGFRKPIPRRRGN
jgi:hypothetical protein